MRRPRSIAFDLNVSLGLIAVFAVIMAYCVFVVLDAAKNEQEAAKAKARLSGILEGIEGQLFQDLVNDRFYAAEKRAEFAHKSHAAQGVDFVLLNAEGGEIFVSGGLRSADAFGQAGGWRDDGERIYTTKEFFFGGDKIGTFVIATKYRDANGLADVSTIVTILIIVVSLIAAGLFTTTLIKQSVVRPLLQLSGQRETIVRYINDQTKSSPLKDLHFRKELQETVLFMDELIDEIKQNQKNREEIQRDLAMTTAVARTTQMLAHDVRRPFSMLQIVLDMLQNSPSNETHALAKSYLPEVRRAMASVNAMISDIVGVGSNLPLALTEVSPRRLIHDTLSDVFRFRSISRVELTYDLRHQHRLLVDQSKIARLFVNIVSNGVEAMQAEGRMWLQSSENDGFVHFTVGNSGSFIAPEDLERVFETFFTKNKAGGTGLGLAIAKRIVLAHGGEITASSCRALGTEFHFSLPIAETVDDCEDVLPAKSGHFRTPPPSAESPRLNSRAAFATQGALRILICDDESIYRGALVQQIKRVESVRRVVIFEANNPDEGVALALAELPDVIVMDLDFGPGHGTGFEAVQRIRAAGLKGTICIHSNRGADEFEEEAIAAGADLILPKPMSDQDVVSLMEGKTASELAPHGHIVIVDDSPFIRSTWEELPMSTPCRLFASPEEFWEAVVADRSVLMAARSVVTDHFFDQSSSLTGLEFAGQLRQAGFAQAIYMSSDAELEPKELAAALIIPVSKHVQDVYTRILQSR